MQKHDIDAETVLTEMILYITNILNDDNTTHEARILLENMLSTVNNLKNTNNIFNNGTNSELNFYNIAQLEQVLLMFTKEQNKISKDFLLKKIENINESELISKKKLNI
jgi:hypothetical protein